MKNPMPCRYCPVNDANQLPIDVMKMLDSYQESIPLVLTVRNCLCASVGAAEIVCDPHICSQRMSQAMDYINNSDNKAAALGGVSKKIYRDYVKAEHKKEFQLDEKLDSILSDLLDD